MIKVASQGLSLLGLCSSPKHLGGMLPLLFQSLHKYHLFEASPDHRVTYITTPPQDAVILLALFSLVALITV